MGLQILFKGWLLGFSIAAPVGPIGVLCIRRTLAEGRAHGFISGLGAASADAIYGCLAAFGLTFVTDLLIGQQAWLRLAGGIFLCYLGVKTLLSRPARQDESNFEAGSSLPAGAGTLSRFHKPGLAGAYVSTLLLTLSNPMTILSFVAVFAGIGLGRSSLSALAAILLVLGVFSGSASWWLLLSSSLGLLRDRFQLKELSWVNRVSGAVILGFGLLALASLAGR